MGYGSSWPPGSSSPVVVEGAVVGIGTVELLGSVAVWVVDGGVVVGWVVVSPAVVLVAVSEGVSSAVGRGGRRLGGDHRERGGRFGGGRRGSLGWWSCWWDWWSWWSVGGRSWGGWVVVAGLVVVVAIAVVVVDSSTSRSPAPPWATAVGGPGRSDVVVWFTSGADRPEDAVVVTDADQPVAVSGGERSRWSPPRLRSPVGSGYDPEHASDRHRSSESDRTARKPIRMKRNAPVSDHARRAGLTIGQGRSGDRGMRRLASFCAVDASGCRMTTRRISGFVLGEDARDWLVRCCCPPLHSLHARTQCVDRR